jgi:hypothetical protein
MGKNKFVFVVCGAREHINTIHVSLRYLKRFSKTDIIVVTDSSRNDGEIEHNDVLDIKTPSHFNHHQASIYLKTSLQRILPPDNLYCYLDTDVIAVTKNVDSIFEQYSAPITFGADHCVLDEFSPVAVCCDCEMEYYERTARLKKAIIQCENLRIEYDNTLSEIDSRVKASKRDRSVYLWEQIKYNLPVSFYHLNETYKLHKKTRTWYKNGKPVVHGEISKCVEQKSGLVWEPIKEQWFTKDGRNANELKCEHLHEAIRDKFKIDILFPAWQHWNGGVFLFDNHSHTFLDWWHEATLLIFKDKGWKTRDQGTLAAAVWKFGLQEHPLLNMKYNFIADYYNRRMKYLNNLEFTTTGVNRIKPDFLHIYHHFGDETWKVWLDVGQRLNQETH